MKLLIADDHPIFRKGLKDILLEAIPNAQIIECENGRDALAAVQDNKPHLAILDIDMPGMNGLELCRKIVKTSHAVGVIILTMYREKEMIRKAMLSGASGYVLKDNAVEEIIQCVHKVSAGGKFIGPAMQPFYQELYKEDKRKEEITTLLQTLSQSELKTLKLVSSNRSTKEIASLLFLSEKTIENYRSRICQKLGLPPRNNSLLLWVSENRELLHSISEF